ncbi:unnamed protein product [Protopolystoma xenopodis]|uniref:Uncharacterized protein n=1 Tax=Protopolystoma xenopodis TaxID=117903 RepID=A0A448WVM1_9PLAT|nr:unnamed protein product [Protopolystoma xenopodis]
MPPIMPSEAQFDSNRLAGPASREAVLASIDNARASNGPSQPELRLRLRLRARLREYLSACLRTCMHAPPSVHQDGPWSESARVRAIACCISRQATIDTHRPAQTPGQGDKIGGASSPRLTWPPYVAEPRLPHCLLVFALATAMQSRESGRDDLAPITSGSRSSHNRQASLITRVCPSLRLSVLFTLADLSSTNFRVSPPIMRVFARVRLPSW